MTPETSSHWKPARRTLVVGVNWIGDTIMSMPAIEAWRMAQRDAHLGILVKKNLAPLWELHSGPDNILTFDGSASATLSIAGTIRTSGRYDRAVIFPNSFRSALVPFLARVPDRIGTTGHFRSALLTRKIEHEISPARSHQAFEYFSLLGIDPPAQLEPPRLRISEGAREAAMARLENLPRPLVAIIPGAARGPSKRWPAEHFTETARSLIEEKKCGIALFGGPDDVDLCEQIREQLGENAASFAGKTGLKEWAAMLACCQLVICNDSGGMHLAAAVGTPLIAIYGLTDPAKTGPLGKSCLIIRDEHAGASRDISRDSADAAAALAAIKPTRVIAAAESLLAPHAV